MPRRELPDPRYVIALDGGEDTGWAAYDRYTDFQSTASSALSVYEIDDFLAVGMQLESWLELHGSETAVIAERYIVTPLSAQKDPTLIAAQVYGMARWLALKHGAIFVHGQTSSAALSMVSDQWLRAIGWYHPGMGHANDACRHVLKYLVDRQRLSHPLEQRLAKMVQEETDGLTEDAGADS